MENMNIKQIDSSLKCGRIFTGVRLVWIYLCMIIPLFIPVLTVLSFILIKSLSHETETIISFVFINLFAILSSSTSTFVFIRNKKNIQKIKLALQDCKQTLGTARRVDAENIRFKPYQIEVTFKIDGQIHHRLSQPGNTIIGYRKYNLKYCKQPFTMLYSPNFDEVIILKDFQKQ